MTTHVGVVGASGRAAAASAVRAGLTPWVVDLFADRDTRRVASVVSRGSLPGYPDGLAALADTMPPGPVIYTGGLENAPDVVAKLSAARPLWGNGPDVLARVRDPFAVAQALDAAGWPTAAVRPSLMIPPPGRWVHKSRKSSGGLGVRFAARNEQPQPDVYLQEFIDGPPMSAQFVTRDTGTLLLGVTDQLVGEAWLHGAPFQYAGNVCPSPMSQALGTTLSDLGGHLAQAFGLRGLWGIDFIPRDGAPVVIEVNPRYTAAGELIDFVSGSAAFCRHATAFGVDSVRREPHSRRTAVGKVVYFAPHPITFPTTGPWDADLSGPFDPWRLPGFADIPDPGERFQPGDPVVTVFATGSTADECRAKLQARAADLDRLFTETNP